MSEGQSNTSGSLYLLGFPPDLTSDDVLESLESKYRIPMKQLKISIDQNQTAILKGLSGEAYKALASQKQIVVDGYTVINCHQFTFSFRRFSTLTIFIINDLQLFL